MAFFSHRHAAYLAGLGTFGVNNMLLTPRYGPRARFTSIFTTADIVPDEVMNEEVCVRCMRCVSSCPAKALSEGDYPASMTDKERCTSYNLGLASRYISPCGVCIKVCPVGKDRESFGRTDAGIYEDRRSRPDLHHAWEHVRAYGGKADRK
jgi:epoxyqueuosine reductase QueG